MSLSTLLCLLALPGAPAEPDWWTLAPEEERWAEAVPLALEAPAARSLAYVLMLEADAAPSPFDLREDYWGTRSPNFAREVAFHDDREQGDALLDPPLAARVAAAGAPQAD